MAKMASKDLPNLKICIDNSEEMSDDDDTVSEVKINLDDDGIADELEDGELVDDTEEPEDQSLSAETDVKVNRPVLMGPKRYENRDGNFVTGIDFTSEEYIKRKEERAKKFGITVTDYPQKLDLQSLYESLGISDETLKSGIRGIRPEAIHFRGAANLSTEDIFKYFSEYGPGSIEWIDDMSCNVVWFDTVTAARAMLNLSRAVDELESMQREVTADSVEKMETDSQAEIENAEESMEESDEDELNLLSSDDENEKRKRHKRDKKISMKSKSTKEKEPCADSGTETGDSSHEHNTEEDKNTPPSYDSAGPSNQLGRYKPFPDVNTIDVPPGKWRVGRPYQRAQFIFMRYATKADKKQIGAEKKSKYYQKYGNPNYGGIRGLISNSRKRKMKSQTIHQEFKEVQNQSRAKILENRHNKPQESVEDELFYDMLFDDADNENGEDKRVPVITHARQPPRGQSQQYNRNFEKATNKRVQEEIDFSEEYKKDSDSEDDIEQEVKDLLGPRQEIQKRSMKMYADDVEEELKTKRPKLTIAPSMDARETIRQKKLEKRSGLSQSSFSYYEDTQSELAENDLRSRLSKISSDKKVYPPLTIEVTEDTL